MTSRLSSVFLFSLLCTVFSGCASTSFQPVPGGAVGLERPKGCHIDVVMNGKKPDLSYEYKVIGTLDLKMSKKDMARGGADTAMTALRNAGGSYGAFALLDVDARVTPNGGVSYQAKVAVPVEMLQTQTSPASVDAGPAS